MVIRIPFEQRLNARAVIVALLSVMIAGMASRVHAGDATPAKSFGLTVGGEYRLKIESLDAPDFDLRPSDAAYTAIGHRGLLHADLQLNESLRGFFEVSAAADSGRKPAERAFDRSRPDIAQAFIDVSLPYATVLRIGRQQLDAGGNRLVSTREAANLRLAFDMVHAETTLGRSRVTAFYGRPVLNERGAFDDRRNPAEKFMGAWVLTPLIQTADAPVVSVFFLSRDRARALYQEGAASDHRRTVGARGSGTTARWDYALQVSRQYGSFGSDDIRAFGFAGDVGWHAQARFAPRIGVSFGYASADGRRDARLDTFDVIYPNLGYFTDAPVYYPGNTADIQPNVSIEARRSLRLRAGCDAVIRISKNDAVYGLPGVPLLSGNDTGALFVAAMSYARAEWTASPHFGATLSFVHGSTSSLIRNAGGRDFNFGALVANFRF